jgi:hypothetical protein
MPRCPVVLRERLTNSHSQDKINEARTSYANGKDVAGAIAQNTTKHHRLKTEQEKDGELFTRYLDVISQEHAKIATEHKKRKSKNHDFDSAIWPHFELDKLEDTHKEVLTQLAAKKGRPAREYQASLVTQIALAIMDRTPHYHSEDLSSEKAHQMWMPALQGVSFIRCCLQGTSSCLFVPHR